MPIDMTFFMSSIYNSLEQTRTKNVYDNKQLHNVSQTFS